MAGEVNRIPPTSDYIVRRMMPLYRRAHRPGYSVGLKRWYIPATMYEGRGVLTRYAIKERRRRRAESRRAKQARKVNRA